MPGACCSTSVPAAILGLTVGLLMGAGHGISKYIELLGIPCLVASQADIEWLQKAIGRSPGEPVTVDAEKQEVRFGDRAIKATVPDGPRNQLVGGTWDSTAVLLEAGAAIESTARRLPYVAGF